MSHVCWECSPRQTQNICIIFIQCRPNVFDLGPTLYKYSTNAFVLEVVCCIQLDHWTVQVNHSLPFTVPARGANPENTKLLYNICPMLDQRPRRLGRRCINVIQMLDKCWATICDADPTLIPNIVSMCRVRWVITSAVHAVKYITLYKCCPTTAKSKNCVLLNLKYTSTAGCHCRAKYFTQQPKESFVLVKCGIKYHIAFNLYRVIVKSIV